MSARLYAPFNRVDGRWIQVPNSRGLPKPQAVHTYQDMLLSGHAQALRPIPGAVEVSRVVVLLDGRKVPIFSETSDDFSVYVLLLERGGGRVFAYNRCYHLLGEVRLAQFVKLLPQKISDWQDYSLQGRTGYAIWVMV